ncbi:hypothetical protein [Pseudomonas citronellolis]|uniref:hypothetical protein n=1 Tax=Pseudomonas citronellolis TaxID=53408 RepID=UPI00248EB5F3|nr:hypothetical protein [Pseudomonas citronellolis]
MEARQREQELAIPTNTPDKDTLIRELWELVVQQDEELDRLERLLGMRAED